VAFADLGAVGAHHRLLVNNEKYFATGGLAAVETKRGCTRPCIYCVEPLVKGRRVRLRDPRDIADEIESLADRGIYAIHINDSEFNLDIRHAMQFCDELRRRRLQERIQWYAYGMPAPFPEALARAMKESGCVGMNFGTDSASDVMLRILKRTFRQKHIAEAVNICKRYGIRHVIEILFGAPGETAETVKETIDFLKRITPERVSVTAGLRVFPGTELETLVRAEGISRDNPNLSGAIDDNEDLLKPLFYLSAQIAPKPIEYIATLIGDDARFFGVNTESFNYNANDLLVEAIAAGERGAYWVLLSDVMDRQNKREQNNKPFSRHGKP
jgi:tryptophan 2-C-methyltransferase